MTKSIESESGAVLRGTLSGKRSRAEIIESVTDIATAFFDSCCIHMKVGTVTLEDNPGGRFFSAAFVAQEHHNVAEKSYGPGICRTCAREDWPRSPLPRAAALTPEAS